MVKKIEQVNEINNKNSSIEKKYELISALIVVSAFLISGLSLFVLPKEIPMQWAHDGTVNYTLPSIIGVWVMPCIILAIAVQYKISKNLNQTGLFKLIGAFIFNIVILAYTMFV